MGKAQKYWNIGDEKDITINNITVPFRIIDFNHDNLSSDSSKTANITLQAKKNNLYSRLHEDYLDRKPYATCEFKISTIQTIYDSMLPADLKPYLKQVIKQSYNGSSPVNLNEYLFILSRTEWNNDGSRVEGKQYDFWKTTSLTTKSIDASNTSWIIGSATTTYTGYIWTRSLDLSYVKSYLAYLPSASGLTTIQDRYSNDKNAIFLCFCI